LKEKLKANYENFEFYKLAVTLSAGIYTFTKALPKHEQYGISSQIQRASVSVASNIAEGSSRTVKDFSRFLDISLGSIYEVITQLRIISLVYPELKDNCSNLKKDYDKISRMIRAYKSKI
jgi:four helix bundle protein